MKDLHLAPLPYPLPERSADALLVTSYAGEPDFLYHYHPQYELTLTLGSAGRRLVGGSVADYAWRDLVLLGPNLPHTWAAERLQGRDVAAHNYVVHFTPESIGLDFLSRTELTAISTLLHRAAGGLAFKAAVADQAALLMQSLGALQGGRRIIGFLTLLETLATDTHVRPILAASRSPFDLERDYIALAGVVDYTQRHGDAPIHLSEIATHAGMSVPTFCRFFRRAAGKSFVEYLNEWRLSRACALLAGTRHSILQVSELAGFNNLSHFNRQFRRGRGLTPRQYRGRAAKDPVNDLSGGT